MNQNVISRFLRHKSGVAGVVLIVAIIALSITAPLFTQDPTFVDPLNRLAPPSSDHLFGTDHLGRDVFAQVLWGGRQTLLIAVFASGIGITLGYILGVCAGYFRWLDSPIMRIMDGLMSFPSIILMICLIGVMGNGMVPLLTGLTLGMIPGAARVVRSTSLSAKELTMVESARSIGAKTPYILFRYIAPSARSVILVQAVMNLAGGVGAISALSFLGIGIDPRVPTWGGSLSASQQYFDSWWMAIFPGIAILLTILGFIMIGDALRDVFDPRQQIAKRG